MIQRIQTVFLLLASAATFGLLALPFASTPETVEQSMLFQDKIYEIQDHIALLLAFCAAGGLSFVSIFLFKNRKSQLLLGRISVIANIIGLILGVVFFMQDSPNLESVTPDDGLGLYLPIISLIFIILALRYIQKDEKLVRSMDRLR
jgi:peptidoglycan/LPS O-acetylase OafA/YrhL